MSKTVTFASTADVNTHIIEKIKENRVFIDGITKNVEILRGLGNEGKGGREFSLVITKLEEAKMWLGKALGSLGQSLPPEYKDETKVNPGHYYSP